MKKQDIERYIGLLGSIMGCKDPIEFGRKESELCDIENSNPELIEDVKCYTDCISMEKTGKRQVCFIGVDLHGAARTVDSKKQEDEVYWLTGVEDIVDYKDSFDEIVISNTLLSDDCVISLVPVTKAVKGEGIIHFFPKNDRQLKLVLDCCCMNGLLLSEDLGYWEIAKKLRMYGDPYHGMNISAGLTCFEDDMGVKKESIKNGAPRFRKVYVPCVPFMKTGGTELLHQLVYWLNRLGCDAYISYGKVNDDELPLCEPQFMRYVTGHVCFLSDKMEDSEDNAIVIAEAFSNLINECERFHKLMWWLSVDNFYSSLKRDKDMIESRLSDIKQKADVCMVQSYYAGQHLLEKGVDKDKIVRLEDYINSVFISEMSANLEKEKEDIVIYNPAKGKEFTEKLIAASKDINWVPIKDLTTVQVHDLMCRAKVYIDFGNHPGKDRIPRESAVCGCCVITGKRGSASYVQDVAIKEEYKFDEETCDMQDILKMIKLCMKEYDRRIDDFAGYREKIAYEKTQFVNDIRNIFFY